MKAFAVVVGLLIVAALAFLLLPHLVPGRAGAGSETRTRSSAPAPSISATPGRVTEAPQPEHPLNAPLSREEQIREELAQKRIPFYRFLRENYADVIEHFGVTQALDTLDLVISRDDDETLRALIENAISPSARQYGFRKVRFLIRNPDNTVEPLALVAEATYDGSGRWNTFRK